MTPKTVSSILIPRDAHNMPPEELIGMAYELAVQACQQEDEDQSVQNILLLQDAVRSAGSGDSADLLRFYGLCLDRIRNGDFQVAGKTLTTLRDTWEKTQ
jgi:hypothetical protein